MKKLSPLSASLLLSSVLCVPAANAMMESMDDWYLRADVGNTDWNNKQGLINNTTPTPTYTDMRPRWKIGQKANYGIGVGTDLAHHFRTDLTLQQTRFATAEAKTVQVGYTTTFGDLSTRVRATSGLVNLYWDLGHLVGVLEKNHISPYIGAGVGLSHNKMGGTIEKSAGAQTVIMHIPGHTRWSAAWQSGAGIAYQMGKMPLALDLSFVHLDAGSARSAGQMDVNSASNEQLTSPSNIDLSGNRWALGLRWYF